MCVVDVDLITLRSLGYDLKHKLKYFDGVPNACVIVDIEHVSQSHFRISML